MSYLPECSKTCIKKRTACCNTSCRKWIDYEEDHNCCLISIDKNDDKGMTLQEVAKRIGLSFVRIRQIEQAALKKISKLF